MVNGELKIILVDTGYTIDITGQQFRINFGVADFGDITKQIATYTWGFNVPKTPENTNAFQGVGLMGDASRFPYRKTDCIITYNGTAIEPNGRFQIKKTEADRYRCFVQAGIIDFYRDISDDKISEVLDLSSFDHTNTVNTIIDSFAQTTWRYLIAGYNGPPLADVAGLTNFSTQALVPSINVEYLWDQIFAHYGWEYNLPDDVFLSNKWMSYPNATTFDDESLASLALWENTGGSILYDPDYAPSHVLMNWNVINNDDEWIVAVDVSNGQVARMLQPGIVRFSFYFKGKIQLRAIFGTVEVSPVVQIWQNGELVASEEMGETAEDILIAVDRTISTNDVISCRIRLPDAVIPAVQDGSFSWIGVRVEDADFQVEQLGVQNVSFSRALIKMKVREFFKEIMMRYSLTAFPDPESRTITFKTVEDRLTAEVINWSDRYVRRISEVYVQKGYAQNNYLRHKYNDENEDHADGNLVVDNANLKTDRDLYKSITYAPEEFPVSIVDSLGTFFLPVFEMFEVEVSENESGDLLADYKPLKDRFYIFEGDFRSASIYIVGTEVFGYPFASINGQTFRDIRDIWYTKMDEIIQDARIHEIELDLSEYDIARFDLSKLYYFEQEQSYYIIQTLKFEPGKISRATCIRVDYSPEVSQLRSGESDFPESGGSTSSTGAGSTEIV